MFTDRVTLEMIAGKGGNGVVAWKREKYIAKGGPTGGNGGDGGAIVLQADSGVFALDWFRNKRHIRAENGQQGGSSCRTGRKGKTLTLRVPAGTLVKDAKTGELIADLTESGETLTLCSGGKGGRGNESFKSPTNQAPNICTPGKPGETRLVELELKLIADVGLVGFPNAGKSTLMNALTHLKVKCAAYPFTTLRPNLSFMKLPDQRRIYIADIPGLIGGASEDRGLGFEFLRHVERTKLLIFVLDASGIDGRDPLSDLEVLRKEIDAYSKEILQKPYLIVLNKLDDPESTPHVFAFEEAMEKEKHPFFQISALTGQGLEELIEAIADAFFSQSV